MRTIALALLGWLALATPALPAQGLAAIEAGEPALRRELRHDELIDAYRRLGETAPDPRIDARLAALTLELRAIEAAAPLASLRALPPAERNAKIAGATRSPLLQLAAAEWLLLVGETARAEDAIADARDREPELKRPGDELLARTRGEPLPDGGYHRYRGRFLPLALRDRARAIDAALEGIAALGGIPLPLAPAAGRSAFDEFSALGAAGPEALRSAAAAIRARLQPEYATVRDWLPSYARSARQRERLLALHEQLATPRTELLELIGRYDKPEQPEVDRRRAALEAAYASFEQELARDRAGFERVRESDAHELLERVQQGERALDAIDAALRAETGSGLEAATFERPAGAATSAERRLPGREQSGLEDLLWLLVQLRAGQSIDVLARGADLQRAGNLTPWEQLVVGQMLADAVDAYNARVACSLDGEERAFVTVLARYRRVLGLRPFEIEERLNAASRKHSQEMVDLGYFGHVSPVPRNRTPSDRARLEGFGGGVGENCLAGQADGRAAFEAWYHSPGHHRGLVSPGPQLGVGAVAGHSMWTMVAGGTDLAWRALHRDRAPADRARCEAAVDAWARALAAAARDAAALDALRAAVDAELPDALAAVARLAFAAAVDRRHPLHETSAAMLAYVVDAAAGVEWRPLQVAAVSACIDLLSAGASVALRQAALDVVRPLVGELAGYAPDAQSGARDTAVLRIRATWEDTAQWQFRRSGPPPTVASGFGRGDGPSARAKLRVLSKPERARLARRHGGGSDTERAVERGLAFLARVQDEDGAWRARAFVLRDPRFTPETAGIGNAEWDIAMTGLSLLAFVTSGHTTTSGEHQQVVRRGVDWLCSRVADYGRFETVSGHYMYGHAIATQALCEVYAYTADPYVGTVAQLALDYLAFAQDPQGGGWRYEAREAGDTSVVGWCVMALNAGHKAGLQVVGFRDALRFLDSVTAAGYYQVGYTGMPGLAAENLRLTAVGMVSRLFLGQKPEEPKIALPAWRLVEHLPDRNAPDFYHWYYATLALFQVGGKHWKSWNAALKDALLALQQQDPGSPYDGSWPPDPHYGPTGGRIYQTALGVLLLTTYYRYDRAPKTKVSPFTGNLDEFAAPFVERIRASADLHERALALAELVDTLGPSLVPVIVRIAPDWQQPEHLRHALAAALPRVAERRHLGLLLPLLATDDAEVAAQVAAAVAAIASEDDVEILAAALAHREPRIRSFAARALGRLAVGVDALSARAAVEQDPGVAAEIAEALQAIARRSELAQFVDAALPPGRPGRLPALEALELLDAHGITPLLLATREAEPKLWSRCVAAVREHGSGAIVPILIALLESEQLPARERAIQLLDAIARTTHDFVPTGTPAARATAVRAWQAWWKEAGAGYGAR